MTYSNLLKDPRWQKKRLEVLERDDWTCLSCGDSTSTLHVHHGFYRKNCSPWEYPNSSLHTLCEECHGDERGVLNDKIALSDVLSIKGFSGTDFNALMCTIQDSPIERFTDEQKNELFSHIENLVGYKFRKNKPSRFKGGE